jgi:ABC-type arginine transport system permease subunit
VLPHSRAPRPAFRSALHSGDRDAVPNTAAFNAEVWRSQPSQREQIEAARGRHDARLILRRIMLPQVWITIARPGQRDDFLIKASLATAVIGIVDLTRVTAPFPPSPTSRWS